MKYGILKDCNFYDHEKGIVFVLFSDDRIKTTTSFCRLVALSHSRRII